MRSKKRNCNPSKSQACGKSCISLNKTCRQDLNDSQKNLTKQIKERKGFSSQRRDEGEPSKPNALLDKFYFDEKTLKIDPSSKEEQLQILKKLQEKAAAATSYNKDVEQYLIKRRTLLNNSEFNNRFQELKSIAKSKGNLTPEVEAQLREKISTDLKSLYNQQLKEDKKEAKKLFVQQLQDDKSTETKKATTRTGRNAQRIATAYKGVRKNSKQEQLIAESLASGKLSQDSNGIWNIGNFTDRTAKGAINTAVREGLIKKTAQERIDELEQNIRTLDSFTTTHKQNGIDHSARHAEIAQLKQLQKDAEQFKATPQPKPENLNTPAQIPKARQSFKLQEEEDPQKGFKSWEKDQDEMRKVLSYYDALDSIRFHTNELKELFSQDGRLHSQHEIDINKKKAADLEKEVKNSKYFNVDLNKLKASNNISGIVSGRISTFVDSKITVSSITDSNGVVQAGMHYSLKRNHLYIEYLATAPWNILEKGKDERSVKGAGTEAIIQAIKLSQEAGFKGQVKLEALKDAVPFYKKMGFTGSSQKMTLSPENAKKTVSKI